MRIWICNEIDSYAYACTCPFLFCCCSIGVRIFTTFFLKTTVSSIHNKLKQKIKEFNLVKPLFSLIKKMCLFNSGYLN